MTDGKAGKLRLKAIDAEDLGVVSACLQDALVAVGDIKYIVEDRRFVLIANRFRWEAMPCQEADELGDGDCFERVHSGLRFENVVAVKTRGLDALDAGQLLELLAINLEPGGLLLVFAGDVAIRVETASPLCFLEDIGEPWPTKWRPKHPLEAPDGTR
ncbi:MAG TPA: DUF2948 family protein [Alphaproteobacteria bacterium]|jgi:hypothetical protein